MDNKLEPIEEQWLTAVEASHLSIELGLHRTPKTVRRWASSSADKPEGRGEVLAKKRDTSFGFEYVIERASLVEKIEQELEFQETKAGRKSEDMSAPFRPNAVRPNTQEKIEIEIEPDDAIVEGLKNEIDELKKENRSLAVDKAARNQMVEFLQDDRKQMFAQLNDAMKAVGDN